MPFDRELLGNAIAKFGKPGATPWPLWEKQCERWLTHCFSEDPEEVVPGTPFEDSGRAHLKRRFN